MFGLIFTIGIESGGPFQSLIIALLEGKDQDGQEGEGRREQGVGVEKLDTHVGPSVPKIEGIQ